MNGWGIAALVFAAGCLVVAGWALSERYRYKGLLAASKWGRELAKDHDMQALKKMEAERDALKTVLEQMIAERDQAIAERKVAERKLDEALIERGKLELQLKEATEARTRAAQARVNSTSSYSETSLNDLPKPKPARTPRTNSRAKPPDKE